MNGEPVVEGAESGSVPNENIADTRVRRLTKKGQEEEKRRLQMIMLPKYLLFQNKGMLLQA